MLAASNVIVVVMSEGPHTLTLVREDGVVVELVESDEGLERLPRSVVLSRFMARRVARELNHDRPSPCLHFEVERLGFLRWAIVAHVSTTAQG